MVKKRKMPSKDEQIVRVLKILNNQGKLTGDWCDNALSCKYVVYNGTEERHVRQYVINAMMERGLIKDVGMEYVGSGDVPDERYLWEITESGRALARKLEQAGAENSNS